MADNEQNLEQAPNTEPETNEPEQESDAAAELARLKSELAKQKAALDKATKEAGDYRKALRSKQTQEEQDAEDRKAREEANQKELEDLRKRFAVMETSKNVIARIGADEAASGKIAEYLYGAADADGALIEIQKIFNAKEKALRLEYGRVPAPGAGSNDGPTITKGQLDAMEYKERLMFAKQHPDEYNRLMGR